MPGPFFLENAVKILAFALALAAAPAALAQAAPDKAPAPVSAHAAARPAALPPVATVNGRAIPAEDYDAALAALVRQRFYHRTPPEGQMAAVRIEVLNALIDLQLAATEAKRQGLAPDAASVSRDLERIESRFRQMPDWQKHREAQVARWRADLEERSLAEALEKRVRAAVVADDAAVRRFYDANPALFTEPEKVRLSLILLRVDPSAGKAARDKAREEGRDIRARLAKGADFAELAKIHSADATSAKGGEMGFVHRGALPEGVQAVIDKLEPGVPSDALDVLEGVAIVKVAERQPAALRPFEAVTPRARDLYRRQAAEDAWKAEGARLRAKATVSVNTARYPDLASAPGAPAAGKATAAK